jgi:hypothetical protein
MPTKDKLRALLNKQERKVPDVVRLKEMNEVRNYDRNQQQKVFDFEKQQVEREKESIQPASAKDVGSAFKLQVYILKINQVLQLKAETYQSLTNALVNPDGQPGSVQRLTGPNRAEAALATTFFSKAELLASFNEMMAFIKTFMPDMLTNARQQEQVYAAYLTPLTNQLTQVQGLYPSFFATFNAQGRVIPAPNSNARKVFEQIRTQCMAMYSLIGTMGGFLDDQNLRPITASDVADFAKQNNASSIFIANPLAPPGVPVQRQIDAQARQTAAAQAALQAQQAERAAQGQALADQVAARAQMGQQTQQGMQDTAAAQAYAGSYNNRQDKQGMARAFVSQGLQPSMQPVPVAQAVQSFQQQRSAQGVPDAQAMSAAYFGQTLPQGQRLPNLFNAIRFMGNTDYAEGPIRTALNEYKRDNQQYATRRGPQAPIRPPVIPPGQQQGAPAQQAPAYATQPGGVLTQPYLDAILAYENEAIRAGRQLSLDDAFAALPQALQQEQIDAHGDEQNAIRDGFQPMVQQVQLQRSAFAQANGVDVGALRGQGLPELKKFVDKKGMFPSKMNPKHVAHFMKIGLQPDIIFKLMKKHGIRDGALAEELEGSGIFDSLKDMASSAWSGVKDSASGWADTISKNMPDMSDVRRAVGKIVPDSFQKHMPDSLKTTFGDKAKNFFGFGATEAGGIPNRHREPFSAPNLDKYGYRQGAAERMRIMPVDMELASGLGRLRGGDQLQDTDIEIMRRQDHHDVDVDVPVAHEQPMHGYGVDGDEDDGMQGGLKQRLMGMPLAMFASRGGQHKNFMPMFSGGDNDPYADTFEGGAEGFYEEEEKPHDHDENPTPFRVRNENYAVNTGRLKKVTYKE